MKFVYSGVDAIKARGLNDVLLAVVFTADLLDEYEKNGIQVIYFSERPSINNVKDLVRTIKRLVINKFKDKYILFQCHYGQIRSMELACAVVRHFKFHTALYTWRINGDSGFIESNLRPSVAERTNYVTDRFDVVAEMENKEQQKRKWCKRFIASFLSRLSNGLYSCQPTGDKTTVTDGYSYRTINNGSFLPKPLLLNKDLFEFHTQNADKDVADWLTVTAFINDTHILIIYGNGHSMSNLLKKVFPIAKHGYVEMVMNELKKDPATANKKMITGHQQLANYMYDQTVVK